MEPMFLPDVERTPPGDGAYARRIAAAGVHPMTDEEHRAAAVRMAPGYLRTPPD